MDTVREAVARRDLIGARAAYDAGQYGYEPVYHAASDSRTMHGTGEYVPAHTVWPAEIARAAMGRLECEPEWRRVARLGVAIIGSRAIAGAARPDSDVDVWHACDVRPEVALALGAAWANDHAPGARIDLVPRCTYVPGYRPRPIVLQGIAPALVPARGLATDLRRLGLIALGVAHTSEPDEPAQVACSTDDDVWSALAWLDRHGIPLSAVVSGRFGVKS